MRLSIALCVAALTGSCASTVRVKYEGVDWGQASVAEGRVLFQAVCAGCHGADGRGRVPVARVYVPAPRNLTRGVYRFRSTASGTLPLRRDLLRTVAEGLPGTAMPSWKQQLGQRQLMSVVLYVQTLAAVFRDKDLAPEADDILVEPSKLAPPPVTTALIAHGRQMYQKLKCSTCHGPGGHGDGPAARTAKNRDGTRSRVFDFTTGIYKGGSRPRDVYRTFVTGLDGTPMPSFADSLPKQSDRWALVYYVLSLTRQRGLWFYLRERPTWRDPARRPER